MELYEELKFDAFKDYSKCDVTIEKPVIFVKLDAGLLYSYYVLCNSVCVCEWGMSIPYP